MSESTGAVVQCGQCGKRYAWKPELAGKRVRCKCGGGISVPAAVGVQPVPVEVLPVATPVPFTPPPLPVRRPGPPPPPFTMQYAVPPPPKRSGRPGYSIGLGIASLVIGCCSILASGFTAHTWNDWYKNSNPPPAAVVVNMALPAYLQQMTRSDRTFTLTNGKFVRAGSESAAVRARIVDAAELSGPAAADRRAMLDILLTEDGTPIMMGDYSRALQRTSAKSTNGPDDGTSRISFNAPGGKIQVAPDLGLFRQGRQSLAVTKQFAQSDGGRVRLTALAINAALDKLRHDAPGVTDAQLGFIASRLDRSTGYTFPKLGQIDPPQETIQNVALGTGGILQVQAGREAFYVLPEGRGLNQANVQFDSAGNVAGSGPAQPVFRPMLPGDPRLMHSMAVYCMVVVGLAVFLIAAGITIFIRPTFGLRLHVWFALLKIGCIVAEVALSLRFIDSVKAGTFDAKMSYDTSTGLNGVVTTVLAQAIYPIVILALFFVNRFNKPLEG